MGGTSGGGGRGAGGPGGKGGGAGGGRARIGGFSEKELITLALRATDKFHLKPINSIIIHKGIIPSNIRGGRGVVGRISGGNILISSKSSHQLKTLAHELAHTRYHGHGSVHTRVTNKIHDWLKSQPEARTPKTK